jgi:serine/threonine protein kinase
MSPQLEGERDEKPKKEKKEKERRWFGRPPKKHVLAARYGACFFFFPVSLTCSRGNGAPAAALPPLAIQDIYDIGRRIAKGGSSVVYEGTSELEPPPHQKKKPLGLPACAQTTDARARTAISKETKQRVAVKKIRKSGQVDPELLWREVSILQALDHPSILRFYEHFEDEYHYYLVTEFVDGKELFEKIVDKGSYSERDAACVVRQIVDAVAYLHAPERNIVHRDLKPENILSSGDGPEERIKLIDFGLSRQAGAAPLNTLCGSSLYIAPELLSREGYDKQIDMWSLGVIVYILLSGQSPWRSPPSNPRRLMQEIVEGAWSFEGEEWNLVSNQAKSFISRLLVRDPRQRMTAQEALAHPWLSGDERLVRDSSSRNLHRTLTRLKDFKQAHRPPRLLDIFQNPNEAAGAAGGGGGGGGGGSSSDTSVVPQQ